MLTLGIDTSTRVSSVALCDGEKILGEVDINVGMTHSEGLVPQLEVLLERTHIQKSELELIAVSRGPGSFTGLRIGSATAKGLGLALDKPLIHIPTVDALAYNIFGTSRIICPMMDARRNQVYTGLYRFETAFQVVEEQMAAGVDEIVEKINKRGEPVVFLGDGVPVQEQYLNEHVEVDYLIAPSHLNRQRAAAVGTLALSYYKKGRLESAKDHQPDYLRLSQAERERMEREKAEEKNVGNQDD